MAFLLAFLMLATPIAIVVLISRAHRKRYHEFLNSKGIKDADVVDTFKYVCGHPDVDFSVNTTILINNTGILSLYDDKAYKEDPIKLGEIPIKDITNATIEDATTIESRVTISRLAFTGLFAFALKKKETNELAYLVIDWHEGDIQHQTIFEYKVGGALQLANQNRNKLVRMMRGN